MPYTRLNCGKSLILRWVALIISYEAGEAHLIQGFLIMVQYFNQRSYATWKTDFSLDFAKC